MPTRLGYLDRIDHPTPDEIDLLDRLSDDERTIEGLPIRLVIALVVGLADGSGIGQ